MFNLYNDYFSKKKKKKKLQECSIIINYMTLNMLLNAYIFNCEYYMLDLGSVFNGIGPVEMVTCVTI